MPPVRVLLVRHAKAGHRSDWDGDDAFRPLTPPGHDQAAALADVLHAFGPVRILSSPATRCVQTVEPLAGRCELQVEDEPSLSEGRTRLALALVRRLLDEHDGHTIVCCTHGDIVPEILHELVIGDGVAVPRDAAWQKGSTWILDADGTRFTGAEYLPPPR